VIVHVRNLKASFVCDTISCMSTSVPYNAISSQDVYSTCSRGYLWYFDTLPPVNTNIPSAPFSFNTPGIKNIMLVVMDINGCKDTATRKVNISNVTANFAPDKYYGCLPLTVHFSDLSTSDTTITQWLWNFGDGSTSTVQSPVHTYTAVATSFTVSLTATNAVQCVKTKTLVIRPSIPDTNFSASPLQICAGSSVSFSPSYPNHSAYNWYFGDGDSSLIKNPSHIFTQGGNYNITLVVHDSIGCRGSKTINSYVKVQNIPQAGFFSSVDTLKNKCYPILVNYTDTSHASVFFSRVWDLGNGSLVVPSTSVGTIYQLPGTYTVSLIVNTTFGCSDTIRKSVKIDGPIADFSLSNLIICKGEKIVMNIKDSADVFTYHWDFGDGYDTTAVSPISHNFNLYPPGGQTNVTLVYWSQDSSCAKSVTHPITLHAVYSEFIRNVTDTLLSDTAHCLNKTDQFTNTSLGADSWTWNFGDGSTSTQLNPSHLFTSPGTYTVTLGVRNNVYGCVDTIRKEIIVFPPASIQAQGGDTCMGSPVQLHAYGGTIYSWTPSTGLNNPNVSNPVANITSSFTYTVTVTNSDGCSKDTAVTIHIIQPPPPLGLDTSIVIGESVTLNANCGNAYLYNWIPPDSLSCTHCPSPVLTQPKKDKAFMVIVKDTLGCFVDSFYYKVKILFLSSLDVPTAFTPNGDGINDIIYVDGWGIKKLLEFKIYNRWGEVLFESNDINVGWDGTFHNIPQNMETYVYTVKAETYIYKDPITKKGYFKLIR
ncbi:MAG TPA: PKD domain-containing protein, partial [Bacteroidia bacterium]